MKRNERGFTLMELMVVIVIVAILAAVAVPLYINYVRDAKRAEAKGAIAAIISAEQVNYQRYSTYADDGDGTNGTVVIVKQDDAHPGIVDEAERNWAFDITANDDDGFTVTAAGKDGSEAEGLEVQCVYTRAAGAVWSDAIE